MMPYPSVQAKENSKLTKEEWREFTRTVWQIPNTSSPDHPAVFPEEIPRRLIKLFSYWGDTVLDPFAGTGTTAVAAVKNGRNSVSIDQNADYVTLAKRRLAAINSGDVSSKVFQGDARDLSRVATDSIGLVITSPPYWNKADYGQSRKNVGKTDGYVHFLLQIRPAFEEAYRVLMPGRKLCVVTANVNQHTDHGLLTFPLSSDISIMLRDIGFVMVNELIWQKDGTGGKWGSYGAQRPIFGSYPYPPNFLFKNVHEYILIFAKPPSKASKGPKAKSYQDLMRVPPPARPRPNGKKPH